MNPYSIPRENTMYDYTKHPVAAAKKIRIFRRRRNVMLAYLDNMFR